MERADGRRADQARAVDIQVDFVRTADGSCLISCGETRVICTASVDEGVPPFLKGQGVGWLTAEYAMLPASTGRRKARDGVKRDGRGVEISRLIGRSLRQAIDRARLGERTITIDCDVLQGDGGTRTASITGGFVALCCAVDKLISQGKLKQSPVTHQVAAVSAGLVGNTPCLDLCYTEDSRAQTDMNMVMDDTGAFIEIQGTGEGRAFTRDELDTLLALGQKGTSELMQAQREALGARARVIGEKEILVLASNNAHKIKELKALLGHRFDVRAMREVGLAMDVDETGETFEDNALLKASAVSRACGYAALADDSGLSVDALSGAPGVRSARYCGHHGDDAANNALLVQNLQGIENRRARFVSAVALVSPFAKPLVVRGECEGVIIDSPRGSGGFGYDPYFLYEPLGKTFAEVTDDEKNAVSHRARAMQKLLEALSC